MGVQGSEDLGEGVVSLAVTWGREVYRLGASGRT